MRENIADLANRHNFSPRFRGPIKDRSVFRRNRKVFPVPRPHKPVRLVAHKGAGDHTSDFQWIHKMADDDTERVKPL